MKKIEFNGKKFQKYTTARQELKKAILRAQNNIIRRELLREWARLLPEFADRLPPYLSPADRNYIIKVQKSVIADYCADYGINMDVKEE